MGGPALRVAIVGYGHAASVFHSPLVASTPGLRVAAIVTSSPERSARVRCEFPEARILPSADRLWQDSQQYDVVVIAAPNRVHVPLALTALNVGLPVVVDKPIAACVGDALLLIKTAEQTGKLLTVFHNARWSVPFLTTQQVIASGVLGEIGSYESRMERYRPVPRQGAWRERGDPAEAGGLLYDLGSHLIDQAIHLFGSATHVYAEMDRRRPGTEVDDDTFVSLRFASGVRARLWMSYVARLAGPAVRIAGLRGTYVKMDQDLQESALQAGHRPGDSEWSIEPPARWGRLSTDVDGLHVDGPVESVRGGYEHFYTLLRDALRSGGPPPVDPADALAGLRIIEAAQESARTHTVVRL
jgi:predicted dehydrogenase